MEEMKSYRCKDCEKQYPNRKENTFGSRKAIREHLRNVHGYKHEAASQMRKKHTGLETQCRCFAKHYDTIVI